MGNCIFLKVMNLIFSIFECLIEKSESDCLVLYPCCILYQNLLVFVNCKSSNKVKEFIIWLTYKLDIFVTLLRHLLNVRNVRNIIECYPIFLRADMV